MLSIANLQRRNAATPAAAAWSARSVGPSLVPVADDEAQYRRRLGAAIVEVRGIRGVSQATLAELVHRSEAAISRWETGKATPSAYDIVNLCAALDAPPDVFIYPPEAEVSPIARRLLEGAAGSVRKGLGGGARPVADA